MRALLVPLLLLAVGGCHDPGREAVAVADALAGKGRWEEAAAAYQALPEEAGSWRAYGAWRSAVVFRDSLHDPARAEEAFADCARSWVGLDWGYTCQVELGDLHRDLGEPRAAIDAYRKALELRPRGGYAEHCLLESGRSYLGLGEPAQARVEWDELRRTFPKSELMPLVELETARSYDLEGLQQSALEAYLRVQRRWPDDPVMPLALFGQAEALEQLGRLDDAEAAFERALRVHPNPDAVRIKLDRLKMREDRREQPETQVQDSGRR